MIIRKAAHTDYPAMRAIYNYEVLNGVATMDIFPIEIETWEEKLSAYNREGENHPLIVAEEGGVIAGYASLSPHRTKHGYTTCVELSIYVSPAMRGRGVASMLMGAIIEEGRLDSRTHSIISVITQHNTASIALHQKFGFTHRATIKEVGFKNGAYHDIYMYQLMLDEESYAV